MLVPNQLVKVKIRKITLEHYRNLGYDVNISDTIMVPPEHLTRGSKSIVQVKCDICGDIIPRPYKRYLNRHSYDCDTCNKCKAYKSKQTCIVKYGVENPMQVEEIKEQLKDKFLVKYGVDNPSKLETIKNKKINTFQEKYGVDNPMQSEIVREKIKNTIIERYGCEHPMQNSEIRAKAEQTNLEKYGVKNPNQSDIVKNKIKETNLNKYGVECVLQDPKVQKKIANTNLERYGAENPFASKEIQNKIVNNNLQKYGVKYFPQTEEYREKFRQTSLLKYGCEHPNQNPTIKAKAIKTLTENGVVPTSSQQIQIHKMVQKKYPEAELNYPFSSCALDIFICVNGVCVDIEYDSWFYHKDKKQKDIKRDKFLQSQGFKTLRIRSGHMIPTEQELFEAIDYLVNTKHHFKEIILSDWKEED